MRDIPKSCSACPASRKRGDSAFCDHHVPPLVSAHTDRQYRSCGGRSFKSEGRRDVPIGVDLPLQMGDLLLRSALVVVFDGRLGVARPIYRTRHSACKIRQYYARPTFPAVFRLNSVLQEARIAPMQLELRDRAKVASGLYGNQFVRITENGRIEDRFARTINSQIILSKRSGGAESNVKSV